MTEKTKISIDEVVESAAAGVLRALDARQAAAGGAAGVGVPRLDMHELVRSGFFVDIVIRAGGFPGPIDLIAGAKLPGTAR